MLCDAPYTCLARYVAAGTAGRHGLCCVKHAEHDMPCRDVSRHELLGGKGLTVGR